MGKFRAYEPEQAWLLPPSVKDVLGEGHLSLFIHEAVERLDTRAMEDSYSDEGQPGYHPKLLLKLWLYAYCLGVTSSRRVAQRTREDLGFRYLAGGAEPDYWTLSHFRHRHPRGLNDLFTQVVEWARAQGWAQLGHIAIDSTRIAANASRDRIMTGEGLRHERTRIRKQIRKWQKQCERDGQQEAAGTEAPEDWRKRLGEIPRQLKQLRKSGLKKQSSTDPESRFLRERGRFVLGYTADIAVSEDHIVVAQRVTQQGNDNDSLAPMVAQVEERCSARPTVVSADSGFYAGEQIQTVLTQGVDVFVPDSNLACELNGGPAAEHTDGCVHRRSDLLQSMRAKLRSVAGQTIYRKRKALVEPVFGTLKAQREGRRFRLRGLAKVRLEFCFMALAYNLTRLHKLSGPLQIT